MRRKYRHVEMAGQQVAQDKTAANVLLSAFSDELEKIAYGAEPSPGGGFLLASHGSTSIPLRAKTPEPPAGVPIAGMTKEEDFDFTYGPGDFRPVNVNKKHAAALTPAGRLAAARAKAMAPGSFARKGPSIADISKPHGFGRPLAGATKS